MFPQVGNITSQVVQLGENMNYVLGRLSLATQEFSQISTGLTDVLTGLKADFQSVRSKIESESLTIFSGCFCKFLSDETADCGARNIQSLSRD